MAMVSVGILLLLVFLRLFSTFIVRRRARRRKDVVRLFLGDEPSASAGQARYSKDLITAVSMEMIQMVRGEEKERFVNRARLLGVDRHLRGRLRLGGPRARLESAEALGAFHDETTFERLRVALDDSSPDVRLAAALSLAAAHQAPDVAHVVERLRLGTEEDSLLVVSLFRSIAEDRPEQIRNLIEDPAVEPLVKAAAVEALAGTGDYTLVPSISALAVAADSNDPTLPRYLRALAALGHPAAAEAVVDGLQRDNVNVLIAAARTAGTIGLTDCAPRLAELLEHENWWLRFRAGEALLRLGPVARETLMQKAVDGSPRAQEAALAILAEQGVSR